MTFASDIERPTLPSDAIDRDPYWIPGDDTFAASAVVQPTTTGQVQDVMRVANEFGVPVWPHSQGRNNGYGGPSPRVRGSIQIGFRNMNRVLEIDEELAYAVVEPGVRWMDLYEAIEAGGHALMLSVPDIGWGSVIGNAMDSGATYMPLGRAPPGTSTGAAWARSSTRCSCSPTSGSSRRWASGCARSPRRTSR
jgi:FAD/FMN-containing dehydrogenase